MRDCHWGPETVALDKDISAALLSHRPYGQGAVYLLIRIWKMDSLFLWIDPITCLLNYIPTKQIFQMLIKYTNNIYFKYLMSNMAFLLGKYQSELIFSLSVDIYLVLVLSTSLAIHNFPPEYFFYDCLFTVF